MKKQKKRFVLSEATLDEINRQLTVNMFVIGLLVMLLGLNTVHFMKEYNLFYGLLIATVIFLLFLIIKSRKILKLKQQELTK
jgi:hypothetical protein